MIKLNTYKLGFASYVNNSMRRFIFQHHPEGNATLFP